MYFSTKKIEELYLKVCFSGKSIFRGKLQKYFLMKHDFRGTMFRGTIWRSLIHYVQTEFADNILLVCIICTNKYTIFTGTIADNV